MFGFRNLHAYYHTFEPGENWTTEDAGGGPIPASNGCKWDVRLDFEYWEDVGGSFKIGCNIKLAAGELAAGGSSQVWWDVWLPNTGKDNWTYKSIYTPAGLAGTWLTNLAHCRRVDALKWIAKDGVDILKDPDAECFHQIRAEFRELHAWYHNKTYDFWSGIDGAEAPLLANGNRFDARIDFEHKGPGGKYRVGFNIVGDLTGDTSVWWEVELPFDEDWTYYSLYTPENLSGTFGTPLPGGRAISSRKWVKDITDKELIGDDDASAFVVWQSEFDIKTPASEYY